MPLPLLQAPTSGLPTFDFQIASGTKSWVLRSHIPKNTNDFPRTSRLGLRIICALTLLIFVAASLHVDTYLVQKNA